MSIGSMIGGNEAMKFAKELTMTGINFGLNSYSSSKASRRAYSQFKDAYQHRHQWEVEDLKAAGLNPILSANSGGTAQGFMAQSPAVDIADVMAKGANSALAKKQEEMIDSNILLNQTNAAKAEAEMQSILTNTELAVGTFEENKLNWGIDRDYKQGLISKAAADTAYAKAKTFLSDFEKEVMRKQARMLEASAQEHFARAGLSDFELQFYRSNPEIFRAKQMAGAFGQYPNMFLFPLSKIAEWLINKFPNTASDDSGRFHGLKPPRGAGRGYRLPSAGGSVGGY